MLPSRRIGRHQPEEHLHGIVVFSFALGLCFACLFGVGGCLELCHLLGSVFLDLGRGENHAQDKDGRTDVECPLHRVGHLTLFSHIGHAYGSKDEREKVAHDGTGVAQEALDGVGFGFLFLVDHIAHHHLEGLHGHVDTSVKQHEHHGTENHGRSHGEAETTGVGQQAHDGHGNGCTSKQIGDAAAKASPRLVAEITHKGLHNHAHEGRQNPEEAPAVGVSAQSGEDAADVSTLQCVGDLYAEEAETDVPQF